MPNVRRESLPAGLSFPANMPFDPEESVPAYGHYLNHVASFTSLDKSVEQLMHATDRKCVRRRRDGE